MSEQAIDHQAAPQGGVIITFPRTGMSNPVDSVNRGRDTVKTDEPSEWRPMMPPELFTPEIGADGIAVYGALALYVNGQTGDCWPSQEKIAQRIGLTRKRVNVAIKVLEMAGLVQVTHQDDRGMKRSNLYHLPHQKSANVQMSRIDTTLSRSDTADVPQRDSRCTVEEHKLNVIEPNDKEPDDPPTPQRPKANGQAEVLTKINPADSVWLPMLGDRVGKLERKFSKMSDEFTNGLVRSMLLHAEARVGPVPEQSLLTGIQAAVTAIERQLKAERDGGRPIRNLSRYGSKIIADKIAEVMA